MYNLEGLIDIYLLWEELNKKIKDYATNLQQNKTFNFRMINLPELVSEGIICHLFNLKWSRNKNDDSSDAKTLDDKKVQIKASINYENDLSSFGPSSKFDILVYCGLKDNKFFIHIFDELEWLNNIQISQKETFKLQQELNRRPRFSIYKQWIKKIIY